MVDGTASVHIRVRGDPDSDPDPDSESDPDCNPKCNSISPKEEKERLRWEGFA